MGMFDDAEGIVKRQMVLFFIVDTSSSMQGTKIASVNEALRDVLPELADAGGSDVELKVACLKFSTGCEWMYPSPVSAETFAWKELSAGGKRDMGAAFTELSKKLSHNEFLKAPSASVAPVLFLMSDGDPTDDYKSGLEKLWKNNWFKYAIKVALAIGDDANKDVLKEFTGNIEAVVNSHTPEALKKWIRVVPIPNDIVYLDDFWQYDDQIKSRQDAMIDAVKDIQQSDSDLSRIQKEMRKVAKCIKVCVRGFSHIAQYKKCHDYAYSFINKGKTCSIISVADGQDGEKHFRSDVGSILAVGAARNQLWHFLRNIEEFCKFENQEKSKRLLLENIRLTEAKIIDIWRKKVKSHFIKNPLTEMERSLCKDIGINPNTEEDEETVLSLYGTTLLAALYVPNKPFWCVIQIGSGLAFALDENNEDFYLVPEEEKLDYASKLGSKNAMYNFRHAYGFSRLNALTLCSDGVSNSFEKNMFSAFIRKIYANIDEYGNKAVQKELKEFFPKLSEQGSGDDVSLAGVFEVSEQSALDLSRISISGDDW